MGAYTDVFMDISESMFEAEDYIEELKKAVGLFHTFDGALDRFLAGHGFAGDLGNADEKTAFLTERLKGAGIPVPRGIGKWYSQHRTIERETAFSLCFAFGLTVEETADFFRRICLSRGFDCHRPEEIVYFYALKNGLDYSKARDIISRIQTVRTERMAEEEIVYTSLIVEEIAEIGTAEELISYLNENIARFGYNNATACSAIRTIWKQISEENGIAAREKKRLYVPFDRDEEEQPDSGEKKRRGRGRADDSIWEIYLQILGLSGTYTTELSKARSIKPLLKDNGLMHPFAGASFPDRDGLNKILNGEHVSYERVRKLLILLVFYRFWAGKALGEGGYQAGAGDADRCIADINANLTDAGYPLLYAGNPYDFILLSSINSGWPLVAFREYMRELFFEKTNTDDPYQSPA